MEAKFKEGELAIAETIEGFKLVSVVIVIKNSKPGTARKDLLYSRLTKPNKIYYMYAVNDGLLGAVEYIKERKLYPIINIENFKIKKVGV